MKLYQNLQYYSIQGNIFPIILVLALTND